jgi:hypothetical protein
MNENYKPEVAVKLPDRISDVVKPWAEISPDQLALVEDSGAWTYGQLLTLGTGSKSWGCARAIGS